METQTGTQGASGSVIPSANAAPVNVNPSPGSVQTPAPATAGSDWTSSFNDETKGYIQNKGFRSPEDLLNSYRNFEKLQGVPQDRILKLPENLEAPEARAIWERLGAPKKVDEYKLSPIANADPKFVEQLASTFFELGVPKAMAEKVTAKLNEYNTQVAASQVEAQKAVMETARQNLQKEWGAAFDQNKNVVDAAARNLELKPEQTAALANALGPDGAMKLLFKLGSATGEHTFVNGQSANQVMAPAQAVNKIAELRSDKAFVERLNSGDVNAMNVWRAAHEQAYPGESGL